MSAPEPESNDTPRRTVASVRAALSAKRNEPLNAASSAPSRGSVAKVISARAARRDTTRTNTN